MSLPCRPVLESDNISQLREEISIIERHDNPSSNLLSQSDLLTPVNHCLCSFDIKKYLFLICYNIIMGS